MFSAQNSWLRYFTEVSTVSLITLDNKSNDPHRSSTDPAGSGELDFETALQDTLAEYGATRDRLEMLEKKLEKMLEIKEAKVKSEYEVARRNLELLEREGTVIRQIMAASPTRMLEDDDITVRAERAGVNSFQFNPKDQGKELPTPNPEQRAQAALEELEEAKLRLAHEEKAREEAEHLREEAERAKDEAERDREDAERARADAERALASVESRVKAAEGRARAVRAQVTAAGTNGNGSEGRDMRNGGSVTIMSMPNGSGHSVDSGRFSPDPFAKMTGVGTVRGAVEPPPAPLPLPMPVPMEEVHRRNPWIAAAGRSAEDMRDPFVKALDLTKKKPVEGEGAGRKRKLSKRNKPPPMEGMVGA